MVRALLDTSVLIAGPRATERLPPRAAISVVSLGELQAGVLRSTDPATRVARHIRLERIRRAFLPIPVDEVVAEQYGATLARARDEGRIEKATDLLIIATALTTNRELHTQDERQARLARRVGLTVHGPY